MAGWTTLHQLPTDWGFEGQRLAALAARVRMCVAVNSA